MSKSKRKGIHVFAINDTTDSPEKKTERYKQIARLESQGEKPLLITIRTIARPDTEGVVLDGCLSRGSG